MISSFLNVVTQSTVGFYLLDNTYGFFVARVAGGSPGPANKIPGEPWKAPPGSE
jgi:hypothetical protein